MEQSERGERDLPVSPPLVWLPHREVVRERHEGDPWCRNPFLHGERDRRHALPFDGPAYQPHGPVAQGSRGREQRGIHMVFRKLTCDLGGGLCFKRSGVVDGAHEGEEPLV